MPICKTSAYLATSSTLGRALSGGAANVTVAVLPVNQTFTQRREELDMRRRVEAERRSTRRSVQIVVLTALGFAAALVVFNPGYVKEYTSVLGQLVLAVVAGLFGVSFAWMRRLAKFDKPTRLLSLSGGDDG